MSTDTPTDSTSDQLSGVTGSTDATFPEPREHGAAVQNVFNDLPPSKRDERGLDRGTLYDHAVDYYREHIGDESNEPHVAVENFSADWLPDDGFSYCLVLTSSLWKAGLGTGDDYRAFYEQHIKLRRRDPDDGGLSKGPLALHVEVMPQFRDLVYKSGDPLECPYGEGTRVQAWSTWAESGHALEHRAYDALRAVYGEETFDLADRNPDSRRLAKAEAHLRHHVDTKNQAVETIEQTKQLIDWGGESEIESYQRRAQAGWVEARVESDRWDLLGFEDRRFSTELKCYQRSDWADLPTDAAAHHPKLEASFAGVDSGALPHVDDWDSVMRHLRTVVATHAHWAGIGRGDLVADEYFDGAAAPEFRYSRPTGRREMLLERYEDRATDIYREALKETTTAVYDLLSVVSEQNGATYDKLEEETGLARSTVRYHVARLAEEGVVYRSGNPVLVIFTSQYLLERSREILSEVYPDDTRADREERAEERERERRERQEANDPGVDDADETGDSAESDADDDLGFRYLAHLAANIGDLSMLHANDDLGDRDVRVRADSLPPDLR